MNNSPKSRLQNYAEISNVPFSNESTNRDPRLNANSRRRLKQRVKKQENTQLYLISLKPQPSHNQIQQISSNQQRSPKNQLQLNKQIQTSSQNQTFPQKSSRKRTQITLFILNCICTLNVACQNLLFFFTRDSMFKYYYLATGITFMNVFFLLNSIYLAKSIKEFVCVSLLIDNILLTQIVASIGFVGLNLVYFAGKWQEYFSIISVPLLHLMLSTHFRFLLINYKWNRVTTIIYKIVFLLGAIVLFGVGTYIMFINFKISQGLDPNIDSRFKDFTLLYTFGNFAFFGEMYMKIGDFDQTEDFEFNYHIALDTNEYQNIEVEYILKEKPKNPQNQNHEFQKFMQSQEKIMQRQEMKPNIKSGQIFF